ncbi:MAG TPA: short-chain dehydrogenase [Rhodospirillaceae bacterium]|nr:short-chain dehydrogenase [Rhodospirillaceae bacterium]
MHILITGASSGLGEAIALVYAQKSNVLSLAGRHGERLEAVAQKARAKGAEVHVSVVDVTKAWGMEDWIKQVDARQPIDLVIANAGISAGTGLGGESKAQALEIFAVNLTGVLNTFFPALKVMKTRGQGQVALMSSLAGFRGFAGAPAYGASKAAVRVYGEALRSEMEPLGIKINVICPGFVETPMTAVNDFSMPFLMKPEKAAKIIRQGLEKNRPRIAFPWPMAALVWLLAALPIRLTEFLLRRLPRKP